MTPTSVDHNVAKVTGQRLRGNGHDPVTVQELGLDAGTDDEHLLRAAESGRLLITNNIDDFELLHDAWRRWPVTLDHAGILILYQQEALPSMAPSVVEFLALQPSLKSASNRWRPGSGWSLRC